MSLYKVELRLSGKIEADSEEEALQKAVDDTNLLDNLSIIDVEEVQ